MAERLVFSLRWDVLLVATLAISIGRLARHRFFSAEDVDGGGLAVGTQKATTLQATLSHMLSTSVVVDVEAGVLKERIAIAPDAFDRVMRRFDLKR